MHRRDAQERGAVDLPKGARLNDAEHVFNARLTSNTVRAVDFSRGDDVPQAALTALIAGAVDLNDQG